MLDMVVMVIAGPRHPPRRKQISFDVTGDSGKATMTRPSSSFLPPHQPIHALSLSEYRESGAFPSWLFKAAAESSTALDLTIVDSVPEALAMVGRRESDPGPSRSVSSAPSWDEYLWLVPVSGEYPHHAELAEAGVKEVDTVWLRDQLQKRLEAGETETERR